MTQPKETTTVWGIVPAAGMSRRMGQVKQTLHFGGSTITGTVTRTLLEAEAGGVVVVTRRQLAEQLQLPADPRVLVAVNDDAESEMIDSIRVGLAVLNRLHPGTRDGVLVVPADMPALRSQSCRACVGAYLADPDRIVIATHGGRRGHPIIFPLTMRGAVAGLEGGLRMLPRMHPERVFLVEVDDPGVDRDIDTAEDYQAL